MALSIGIVGLPNVGKSTLFNALTHNDVLAANYPFATIEPNVGVVAVPDPRLDDARRALRQRAGRAGDGDLRRHRRHRPGRLARARGSATSSSPRSARPTRSARSSGSSPTPTWSTSTGASTRPDDIETINTELILADLQTRGRPPRAAAKESRMRPELAPAARRG